MSPVPDINIIPVKEEPLVKQRRKPVHNRGKFPFEFIHNIETDQVNQEEFIYS